MDGTTDAPPGETSERRSVADRPTDRLYPEVLLTSELAYPAFERAVLQAEREILMGFRVFEARTRLVTDEARAVGRDWGDLLRDALDRGVRIDLTLSDFDPVTRPVMHRRSWRSLKALREAAERSDNPDLFTARVDMHPARVGLLPRIVLWPMTVREIRRTLADLNQRPEEERREAIEMMPALRPMIRERRGRLVVRLWPPPTLCPVTHHQKLAVFDERVLYIGGLDLNERRRDTREHRLPANETWHDVQLLLKGPAAAPLAVSAATHLRTFRNTTRGHTPEPAPGLLRTLSQRRRVSLPFQSPQVCLSELADAHYEALARSKGLVYLESQYFRDRTLARRLAARARAVPDLGLIVILPAAPEEVAFMNGKSLDSRYGEYMQATCLDIVRNAFGPRCFVGTPAQPRHVDTPNRDTLHAAPIIYLHSKVSIFDGHTALVSSANLNGRSFRWDTEAGVRLTNEDDVAQVVNDAVAPWLPEGERNDPLNPRTAVTRWRAAAEANRRAEPEARQGFLLPYREEPARRFGRNLPGVPEDMV